MFRRRHPPRRPQPTRPPALESRRASDANIGPLLIRDGHDGSDQAVDGARNGFTGVPTADRPPSAPGA